MLKKRQRYKDWAKHVAVTYGLEHNNNDWNEVWSICERFPEKRGWWGGRKPDSEHDLAVRRLLKKAAA